MRKIMQIVGTVCIASSLFLSGCGEDNNTVEVRMLVQQYLDEGKYDAAIALLQSKSSLTDSDKMLLSAAYMGKSGFSYNDILKIIIRTNNDENNSDSAYSAFLQEVQTKVQNDDSVLNDMDKAYQQLENISTTSEQVKLNKGMIMTMKSSAVFSLLSDPSGFSSTNDNDLAGYDLVATGCALTYVKDNTYNGCSDVTSSNVTIHDQNYTLLAITPKGTSNVFYKLANSASTTVIATKGICTQNNLAEDANCIEVEETVYAPTPILDGNATVEDVLVDTLNQGFDAIVEAAPDDVKDDIQNYKEEIDTNGDGIISNEELAKYLEDNAVVL